MSDDLRHMDVEAWKHLHKTEPDLPEDVILWKDAETCVKEVDLEKREVTIAYSSESIDREGDVIRQKGIDLKAFRKNPVVLFAHGSRYGSSEGQLPVARSMKLFRSEDNLKSFSVDRFAEAELNPLGDTVFRMLTNKPPFLNAASIGFRPIKVERREVEEGDEEYYYPLDYIKTEKLEHSIVPVPANAEALREAKSLGIDLAPIKTWAEGVLDHASRPDPMLTREHLEACYRIASGAKLFTVPEFIQARHEETAEIAEGSDAEVKMTEESSVEAETAEVAEVKVSLDDDVFSPEVKPEPGKAEEPATDDVFSPAPESKEPDLPEEPPAVNIGTLTIGLDVETEDNFEFPSIKDEGEATKDHLEIQVSEIREGLRTVTGLIKQLVGAIKIAGSPESKEPEETENRGDEVVLLLADDEPETKDEPPSGEVRRFIAEETAKAVKGAINRHTGRLPN